MNVSMAALLQSKDLTSQLLQCELQNAISEKISVRALLDEQIVVNNALNDDLENLYNQFAQMQVSQIQTQNNENSKIIETFQKEQQTLQDRLTLAQKNISIQEEEIIIHKKKIDDLKLIISENKSQLDEQQSKISDLQIENTQQADYIKILTNLLSEKSLTNEQLSKQIAIVEQLHKQELNDIQAKFNESQSNIQTLKSNIEELKHKNEVLKTNLSEQQIKDVQKTDTQNENENVKRELQTLQNENKELKEENERIKNQTNQINEEIQKQFNIQPQEINQFGTNLTDLVQQLMDYINVITNAVQQAGFTEQALNNNLSPNNDIEKEITEAQQNQNITTDIQPIAKINTVKTKVNSINSKLLNQEADQQITEDFPTLFSCGDISKQVKSTKDITLLSDSINFVFSKVLAKLLREYTVYKQNMKQETQYISQCYLVNKLIKLKVLTELEFWNKFKIYKTGKYTVKQCQIEAKTCCYITFSQLSQPQFQQYKEFCQFVDNSLSDTQVVSQVVDSQNLNQQNTQSVNQTK
ncbi:Hypothetical_protein [Hexamita inflata]|uniref:Hypothetical_protein n=1 Tax=Hexamita inflata TaxID=28002 RepID=A0AA86RC63_9EUKA|nr:Hypothetical protein HINF_LOCUS62450 [Hexamita inflata]